MKWIAGSLLLVAAVGVLRAGRSADSKESAAAGQPCQTSKCNDSTVATRSP